jgi:hypothetical protein
MNSDFGSAILTWVSVCKGHRPLNGGPVVARLQNPNLQKSFGEMQTNTSAKTQIRIRQDRMSADAN